MPGIPRSEARLSAIASSRRIRPATASLVSGGSASEPSSSRDACLCSIRSRPAAARCSGTSSPRISRARCTRAPGGHRGAGRAAQVGVVEVGQPVGGGAHLAAHPALLPGQHRVVRAEPGEQRADRVAVADDDAVHAAHLAGLGRDLEPAGRADQGERGLRARAGHLQGRGAARLGQRAVRQERAAPGGLGVAGGARDHLRAAGRGSAGRGRRPGRSGGPADRRPPRPARRSGCLCAARPGPSRPGRRLCPKISRMSLRSRRAAIAVSSSASITIRPLTRCSPPGEPQDRRDLRLAAAGPGDGQPGDLVLHRCRHRHGPILPRIRKIRSYAAANSSGSCRGDPSGAATGASSTVAPSRWAASIEAVPVGHGGLVGEHHVDGEFRGVSAQNLQVTLRREAVGFTGLRCEVQREHPAGPGRRSARRPVRAPAGAG